MDIVLLLFYAGWCVVNGMIAMQKGRDVGAIASLSVVVTPLLIYLYLVAVPVLPAKEPSKPAHLP